MNKCANTVTFKLYNYLVKKDSPHNTKESLTTSKQVNAEGLKQMSLISFIV